MDLSWDYFKYSLQAKTHCCAQKQELAILAFKKYISHMPLKLTKSAMADSEI